MPKMNFLILQILFKKRIKEITIILEYIYQKIRGINDTTKDNIERSNAEINNRI